MAIYPKESATSFEDPSLSSTVSDVIVNQLSLSGIKHLYGVAGDAVLPLLTAIEKHPSVRYMAVRHESTAAFMASAEGKLTGHIAVCLGTSGPGLVNMLNGIADAATDRIPMLVITGQVETKKVGTEAKQYIDQQQMIAPLAVYSTTLLHPEATLTIVQKALLEAEAQRGVAHISIPKDVLTSPCPLQAQPPLGIQQTTHPQNLGQLDQAVQLLSTARKPMILIGAGGRQASMSIAELAEALQAGLIETLAAKGTIPYDHPLYIGGIGEGGNETSRDLLQQSDCILVIGANWWPEGYVPRDTNVIQIDVSPSHIEAHPEVVCGLVGDAAQIIPLFVQQVARDKRHDWQRSLREAKAEIHTTLNQERTSDATPISPSRLIAALDETVHPDAIIAIDTGDHTVWFNRVFRAKRQHVLFSGKWRTMGFGLPAALAAKIASPDKQVIAFVGDGCMAMSMMEIATAVQYEIPIVIVVVNNGSLAMEKNSMIAAGMPPFGVTLTNPDFAQMAAAFGAKGIRVETADDLKPALKTAYEANVPVVVDVLSSDEMPPFTFFEEMT